MPLSAQTYKTLALLSGLVGAAGGYGYSALTSPTTSQVEQLQKQELADQYTEAVDDLKNRIAVKLYRRSKLL